MKYVDIELVNELTRTMYLLQNASFKLEGYIKQLTSHKMFCRKCGAIDPPNGFYPLASNYTVEGGYASYSWYKCNDCVAKERVA